MDVKTSEDGTLIEVGGKVRLEQGPKLTTAVATKELLHNDQTAGHYYAGVRQEAQTQKDGSVKMVDAVGVDALGKKIVLGEEMTYAQWGGGRIAPVLEWKLYQLLEIPEDEQPLEENIQPGFDPAAMPTHRWEKIGGYDERDAALVAATTLAQEIG